MHIYDGSSLGSHVDNFQLMKQQNIFYGFLQTRSHKCPHMCLNFCLSLMSSNPSHIQTHLVLED